MNLIKFFLLSFLFWISFSVLIFPQQDTTKTIKIELKDGSALIGKIITEDEKEVSFKTLSNIEIKIPIDQIVKRKIISSKIVKGKVWNTDPNKTRLFFAPTGKALKAGNGYFSAYEIFFPFFAIGVTDFFTIAGGISLIPGADEQVIYFAPKITPYETDNFSISGGVLYIQIPDASSGVGVLYGVSSYNYKDVSSITIGLGYGFSGGDFTDKPVLVLGWENRVSKSLKIISENWFFFGGEIHPISFGLRFFGKNLAADFGLIYPAGTDIKGFPFIPWLGLTYNF